MEDRIGKEKVVHGRPWDAMHGGYFSDPAVARPLVEAARDLLARSPADVVVDLGGGTGFLLSQLASAGCVARAAMVNVDCSEAQLALADGRGISSIRASLAAFRRSDLAAGEKRVFYLMRSVLHYLGQDGLSPFLHHLREQARNGEFFLHQSASFETAEQAACLNALYRLMHTQKWYLAAAELTRRLADARWRVVATTPASPLPLTSDELARRYALDAVEVRRIRDLIAAEFRGMDSVFQLTPSGFEASLHYRIYTCLAATPEPPPR